MVNELDPDQREAALAELEHVIKSLDAGVFTSSVADRSVWPYQDGSRYDSETATIWSNDHELRDFIGQTSSPLAARHMDLAEMAGFRSLPLPRDLNSICARLQIWMSDIVEQTHADDLMQNQCEERAAVNAASAAATAWHTDWENLMLSPFKSRTELVIAAGPDGLECSTAQAACNASQWMMSESLRKELRRLPFSSHIQADGRGTDGISLTLWGPMPTIIDNTLSPLDKLRAIRRAKAEGLEFTPMPFPL